MKKAIKNIISAGLLLLFVQYFLLYKKIKQNNRDSLKTQKRLNNYYTVSAQWIYNLQNGRYISSYLEAKKIHCIAIYGIGNLAEMLINELSDTNIKIVYGIDQNAENYEGIGIKFPVITPDKIDIQETVDAIIVTPVFAYYDIAETLRKKGVKFPILSLEEVVFNTIEEEK